MIDFAAFTVSVAGLMSVHQLFRQRLEEELHQLRSILAVCAWCRRIRDHEEGWVVMERYMAKHAQSDTTHGICPDCARKVDADAEG